MNENDDLASPLESDLLRSFVVVAAVGSVTRAAARLGRTQSAISVHIKRLERRLGARLFEREARGVRLTPAGERLLPNARRLLDDLQSLRGLFIEPVRGRVRVGMPDDYDQTVLQDILATFCLANPDVAVSVQSALSATFPQALRDGVLDLAVHTDEHTGTAGLTLAGEALVWAAGKAWTAVPGEPVPLALFARNCWWRERAISALNAAGLAHRPVFESESVRGVKAAIACGLAVGILSARTVDRQMRVLGSDDGFPALKPARVALLRNETASAPAVAAMADAIVRRFQRLPAA